jgi:hypothetical protein
MSDLKETKLSNLELRGTSRKCVICGNEFPVYSALYSHEPFCVSERLKKPEAAALQHADRTLATMGLEVYLQHHVAEALANGTLSGELFQYARIAMSCRLLHRACENLLLSSQHLWEDACQRLQQSGLAMKREYTGKIEPIYSEKIKIVSGGDWRRAFVTEIEALRRFGFAVVKLEHYLRRDPTEGTLDSDLSIIYSAKVQPREFYTQAAWQLSFAKTYAHVKRINQDITIRLFEDSRATYCEKYCAGQKFRWHEYDLQGEGTWRLTDSGVELTLVATEDNEYRRQEDQLPRNWIQFLPAAKFSHQAGWENDQGRFRRLFYRPLFQINGQEQYAYDSLS